MASSKAGMAGLAAWVEGQEALAGMAAARVGQAGTAVAMAADYTAAVPAAVEEEEAKVARLAW